MCLFVPDMTPGYDSSSNTVVSRPPLSFESILLQADIWKFLFDLGPEQLLFPPEEATATLRPDGVFYTQSTKTVILLDLTVPQEDRPCSCGPNRKNSKSKDCKIHRLEFKRIPIVRMQNTSRWRQPVKRMAAEFT